MSKPIYQVDYSLRDDSFIQVNATSEEEAIAIVEERLDGQGEITEIEAHCIYNGNHDEN